MTKRIALSLAVFLAALVALHLVTRPVSLVAPAQASTHVTPKPQPGRFTMWIVSLVPGTGAIYHETPWSRRMPALGEPIYHEGLDLESKLQYRHALAVHEATMPRGEALEAAKRRALGGWNARTPEARGQAAREETARKLKELWGVEPETVDAPSSPEAETTDLRIPELVVLDPSMVGGGGTGGDGGGGKWDCPCYYGEPCPQGCCGAKVLGPFPGTYDCFVSACIDCKPT